MKKFFLQISVFLSLCSVCFAQTPADYARYYEIDLDEELPSLEELQKKYTLHESDYDKRYTTKRYIGNIFDSFFKNTITLYGSSEARIVTQTEEDLMEMIKKLPKEYYQYIGPYLHVAYGIPEKIKNMPGIKETKNKFPTRIAPQLEDMEDIEFLSPYLYFILMPEIWPSNLRENEYIKMPKETFYVSTKLPDDFMERVHKIVPPEEFYPDSKIDGNDKLNDLRTIKPTKDSPLTGGDIKAFAGTITKVNDFTKKGDNYLRLINAGSYLDLYEADKGKALPVNTLKDIVNPCQRLAQKIQVAGLKSEFAQLLAEDGFDVKGWAYTCDKTVKAYRKSTMSTLTMQNLQDYKRRVYERYIRDNMSYKKQQMQFATMQSLIEMYKSPQDDWLKMFGNNKALTTEFEKVNYMLGTEPLSF